MTIESLIGTRPCLVPVMMPVASVMPMKSASAFQTIHFIISLQEPPIATHMKEGVPQHLEHQNIWTEVGKSSAQPVGQKKVYNLWFILILKRQHRKTGARARKTRVLVLALPLNCWCVALTHKLLYPEEQMEMLALWH